MGENTGDNRPLAIRAGDWLKARAGSMVKRQQPGAAISKPGQEYSAILLAEKVYVLDPSFASKVPTRAKNHLMGRLSSRHAHEDIPQYYVEDEIDRAYLEAMEHAFSQGTPITPGNINRIIDQERERLMDPETRMYAELQVDIQGRIWKRHLISPHDAASDSRELFEEIYGMDLVRPMLPYIPGVPKNPTFDDLVKIAQKRHGHLQQDTEILPGGGKASTSGRNELPSDTESPR